MIKLYHFTEERNVAGILKNGLIPRSRYETFSPIREGVVFCWLSPNDNKLSINNPVCFEVNVNENLCMIADMEYVSLAMMYKYGGEKYGVLKTPINNKASDLFIKIYEITATTINKYNNYFFTPEILVKGKISPNDIAIFNQVI